jgi:hypothetical protein
MSQDANSKANALAQQVSGYDIKRVIFEVRYKLTSCAILAIQGNHSESADGSETSENWRKALIEYTSDPNCSRD